MKADSYIFTSVQKPMTVFGVPPLLLALTMAAFGVSFAIMIVLDFLAPSLPVSVTVFVGLGLFFYRRTRQDHHFVNILIVPPRFWRGRKVRHLKAGMSPALQARGGQP